MRQTAMAAADPEVERCECVPFEKIRDGLPH